MKIYEIREYLEEKNKKLETIKSELDRIKTEISSLQKEEKEISEKRVQLCNSIKMDNVSFMDTLESVTKRFNSSKLKYLLKGKQKKEIIESLKKEQEIRSKILDLTNSVFKYDADIKSLTSELESIPYELQDGSLVVKDDERTITTSNTLPGIEDIYMVHITDKFPEDHIIQNNFEGRKKFPIVDKVADNCYVINEYTSSRHTVHFTLNERVQNTADGKGNWHEPDYIIIEPYSFHQQELISGLSLGDSYTASSLKLSSKAILLVKEEAYAKLNDEQKSEYQIIKYKGDSTKCLNNFFDSQGIPVVINNPNNAGHSYSEEYALETALDNRNAILSSIYGYDVSDNMPLLTSKDVATLFSSYSNTDKINNFVDEKEVEFLSKYTNNRDLARYLITHGIARVGNQFLALNYEETKEHLRDDFYYRNESVQNVNHNDILDSASDLGNIVPKSLNGLEYVGFFNAKDNRECLKEFVRKMNLDTNHVLIVREDGMYISTKKESDLDYIDSSKDILLASRLDPSSYAIDNYKALTEEKTKAL